MTNARELAPGHILGGGYTVRARLGSTASATTYAGLAAPRRDVAIKVYERAVGDRPDVVAALERADNAVLALPPRLVLQPLAGARDAATGLVFRVTPLSVHPSLAQLTELCPLSVDELTVFVGNAARALAAAHERGLVHGALKPTNVFVGPAPKHAVQLGDFGASACLAALASPSDEARLWLAPEQTVGASPTVASDVFGLALVAYFAATRTALPVEELARGSTASNLARASGVALPSELDEVFARALSPKPNARYGTVTQLAEAFRAAIAARPSQQVPLELAVTALAPLPPTSGSPVTSGVDAPPRRARKPWLIAGLAAGVVAGTAALAWGLTHSRAKAEIPATSTPTPTPTPTPTSAGAVAPAGSAPAGASAVTSTSTSTSTSAGAIAPAGSALTSTSPGATQISVECEPSCEFVMIDGKSAKHFPMRIAPGVHGVGVSRRGFFGDWRKVTVSKGEHEVVKFRLLVDPKKRR